MKTLSPTETAPHSTPCSAVIMADFQQPIDIKKEESSEQDESRALSSNQLAINACRNHAGVAKFICRLLANLRMYVRSGCH